MVRAHLRPSSIVPRLSSAKAAITSHDAKRIFSSQQRSDIFRNVFKALTLGRPISEEDLHKYARLAADRALDRDIVAKKSFRATIKALTEMHFERAGSSSLPWKAFSALPLVFQNLILRDRRILAKLPERKQIVFKSGAIMDVETAFGFLPSDSPPISNFYGLRFFVRPSQNERKLPDYDLVEHALKKHTLIKGLSGSVGYFACTLHAVKGERGYTAVIWTRQVNGLPDIKGTQFASRYKNWDIELLRYLEPTLKKAGVARVAVPTERWLKAMPKSNWPAGLLEQYREFDRSLEKLGYVPEALEFKDVTEYLKTPYKFRVKTL